MLFRSPHQAAIIDAVAALNNLDSLSNTENIPDGVLSSSEKGVHDVMRKILSGIKNPDRKKAILLALAKEE